MPFNNTQKSIYISTIKLLLVLSIVIKQCNLHTALHGQFYFCPFTYYDKSVCKIWNNQLSVILDAIFDLKTMISTVNAAPKCFNDHYIVSIIVLVLLYFYHQQMIKQIT